ncbi:alpha/beta hydrolase [Kaistia algarum]|uniref:alpha/beta hydrolase n=1 Tax=Kaistia algarum TaxID=2083279 RepID=UPI00225413FD|nr:alpha/beta hydrolase [Kaistia algarum]MCX5514695.1 alpha/beta hydrolase [Kaistia algarum]
MNFELEARLPQTTKPWRTIVLVMAMIATLTGCASRPEGLLVPIATPAADASKVDMLVATTRAPDAKGKDFFNGERGDSLSLANVVVSIPPVHVKGNVEWPPRAPGDPERYFTTTAMDTLAPSGARQWFKDHKTRSRRVLIFVHGFNTPFDASVFRFAQIVHDSGSNVAPILFSWPSRGSVLAYNYDRESANFSRSDLASMIEAAASSPDVSDVTIMAHSMGSWVAVEALRDIALKRGRVPAKVSNLILASPDLDIDVFRKQVREIGPKRPHITVFISTNDRALRVSRLISGQVTRVGAVDLSQEQYLTQLQQADNITVLDLSALQDGDRLNHSQFATSPEVVQLLGEGLIDGNTLDATPRIGGGDQLAAGAVGTGQVIGSVLSAPVLIFQGGGRN